MTARELVIELLKISKYDDLVYFKLNNKDGISYPIVSMSTEEISTGQTLIILSPNKSET